MSVRYDLWVSRSTPDFSSHAPYGDSKFGNFEKIDLTKDKQWET
ncbi:hypothetical protein CKA32_003026 [Geitlerinema sp. FC II]|nr:hypothetical protein CKA32_003026 [Geitlerinema sp. FC II]